MSYQESQVLATLAARAAISDLSVRQLRAYEAGDLKSWLGTFLVEGVLDVAGTVTVGHASLSEWFGSRTGGRVVVTVDPVVEVDRVHASQRSRLLVLGATGVEAVIDAADELVFERGRWYFARRQLTPAGH